MANNVSQNDGSTLPKILIHQGDLPPGLELGSQIAIDSETMGLQVQRDRLCLVQLTDGDGTVHLVKFETGPLSAPNLRKLLGDPSKLKIFHFARFDLAALRLHLDVACTPVYCTKIASKLVRTYTDRHGLKDLVRELTQKEITKTEQSSDWGSPKLSDAQRLYAARDVLYLHEIMEKLEIMLAREGRTELARQCFDFLPARVELDLAGWGEIDIFAHS